MSDSNAGGGFIDVRGAKLWYQISGQGEPLLQIHGSGFGHFNFGPATPLLSKDFRCIDYDQRGYGQSEKPEQHYDIEVWADDAAGMLDELGISKAHIHGTSMGGMVAIVIAGKYPERVQSVVINCAAAKLGYSGQLVFRNWIDLIRLEGCGSRTLAELIAWQCLSRAYTGGPRRRGCYSADPARRKRGSRDDRGLSVDDRDGPSRLGGQDHFAGTGARRR